MLYSQKSQLSQDLEQNKKLRKPKAAFFPLFCFKFHLKQERKFSTNLTLRVLLKLVPTDHSSAVLFRNWNKYWIMAQVKPARESTYFQNEELNEDKFL